MLRVVLGDWADMTSSLQAIRREVFIVEQGVPEDMEWDEHDAGSVHALALLDDFPVGCGRLLPDGHIGRMAVRAHCRAQGVGRAVLRALVDEARRRGHRSVELHAQTHAQAFYEGAGFVAFGPEFEEAGIPHRRMSQAFSS